MPIRINSPGWRVKRVGRSRGAVQAPAGDLPGVPPDFLPPGSRVAEEAVLEPAPAVRGREVGGSVDLVYDVEPGHTAILAVRRQSGALTFHPPVESTSRGVRGPSQVRFHVPLRQSTTRGLVGTAIKAIVIKVAKVAADKAASLIVSRLAEGVEQALWRKLGVTEGWKKVTKTSLGDCRLVPGKPVSPARSLLFLHGTFSHAASTFHPLATSDLFDRVQGTYGERIFAFDHFSVSRTPEQNARMLLEALPEQATTFDVVTHSRGGLVARSLVERAAQLGDLAHRFKPGRVVLVASPNDGTPLATPRRFEETLGLIANLLEMFPDNPFTTGAGFVANGLVWLANHASGDLPGLHSMDGDGEFIAAIQGAPGPPTRAYSALVANYNPTAATLERLLDVGIDQFFGTANDLVVPAEGGWRVDRPPTGLIPGTQIGCFGPGGNLASDSVTHLNFFSQPATVDFLANGLLGQPQSLPVVDPRKNLPDRRLLRGAMTDVPAARIQEAAAATRVVRQAPTDEPIRITVTNGDLTFVSEPLLLGHYAALQLTGTERVMDRLIGGGMTRSLEMGVYPVTVGAHQIFINSRPNLERGSFMPRPQAVVIVGLGEEGKLRPGDLVQSVRQAVIGWGQRIVESKKHAPKTFELCATLLGSGGTGVSAADAARLVAQGAYEANQLLRDGTEGQRDWPRVSHLQFIELYLDRATDAWRALRLQAAATPGRYAIDDAVRMGMGPLDRPPDSGYRGAEFDFISVETKPDKDGTPMIAYTLDTRRARSEVRGQRAQSRLLTELVSTASNDQNRDQQIGRTLFNLLVPVELEPYLAGSGEMQIELDPQTAKIPWELLDTNTDGIDEAPWAIRVRLLRKLRIQEFRERVSDATPGDSALVVGEPACPPEYPRLLGARGEAIAVRGCLGSDAVLNVVALISDDPSELGATARDVVGALFERPWRIVHISGHGMPGVGGAPGGVVLSNGAFLGPDEFRNMRTVPELVFVNCCHLGAADAAQLLNTRYDRAEFASGVAGALIAIGVRCVVAAGWAVDDEAATVFAEEFYQSLLRGNRFIVAVAEARAAARDRSPSVNTWAAYQCYGDPNWVFRSRPADPNEATTTAGDDFSGIGSATALKLALRRIIVRTKFQGADVADQLRNLAQLEKLFEPKWGSSGDIAELFGEAFVEAGDVEKSMRWYEVAVAAPDGRASMKAAEQLANVRTRLGWEIVDKAARDLEGRKTGGKAGGTRAKASTAKANTLKANTVKANTVKARAAAGRARKDAEATLQKASRRADRLIASAITLLEQLIAVEPTMERASLIGSSHKRRALINAGAGRRARVQQDLRAMRAAYEQAQHLGEKSGATNLYYPIANRLTAEVALHAGTPRLRSLDVNLVKALRQSLHAKSTTDPDFWSVVGEAELDQYEALASRKLSSALGALSRAYKDLYERVTATRMWASVYDTACLVLPNYMARATGKEKRAAEELLAQLRSYTHPDEGA